MQDIIPILCRLDEVYHTGNLIDYETLWQEAAGKIAQLVPGFTVAYAEIYNAGEQREPLGSMRHALVPLLEKNS